MNIDYYLKNNNLKLEGYGKNKFIINGKNYYNPVILVPNKLKEEKELKEKDINVKFLNKIIKQNKLELLILGCDIKFRNKFSFKNSSIEIMDVGAACRTINILLSEGRRVGALLFPIKN